jgi:hypothetical protein
LLQVAAGSASEKHGRASPLLAAGLETSDKQTFHYGFALEF